MYRAVSTMITSHAKNYDNTCSDVSRMQFQLDSDSVFFPVQADFFVNIIAECKNIALLSTNNDVNVCFESGTKGVKFDLNLFHLLLKKLKYRK